LNISFLWVFLLYVGIQHQGLCEYPGMKDRRALSTVAIVCHDVKIVGAGLDSHARGFEIVALVAPWKEHLTDRYAVAVEHQDTPLAVDRHIDIAVTICAHRIWSHACEVIGNGRADGRNLGRSFQIDAMQQIPAELRRP
jgi:hypothetical protein